MGTARAVTLNGLLVLASLTLTLGVLEAALHLFAGAPQVRGLHNVAPDDLSFEPNSTGRYVSTEFAYSLIANAFGRRDRNWTREDLERADNILFIGDSFVMGHGVSEESTIPSLMETIAQTPGPPKEVFNFGMGGEIALPEYKALMLQAFGLGIQAKTVVVGIFVGNDFSSDRIAIDAANRTPTVEPAPVNEEPAPTRELADFVTSLKLYTFVKDRTLSSPTLTGQLLTLGDWTGVNLYHSGSSYLFLKTPPDRERQFFQSQLDIMLDMNEIAVAHGRDILFVVFPNKVQVENYESLKTTFFQPDKPNEAIRTFCEQHTLRCLDLLPPLRARYLTEGPLYFPLDRHLNPRGNDISARLILEFVKQ